MQYFRNTSRHIVGRTDPHDSNMFPLCRFDKTLTKPSESSCMKYECKSSIEKPMPICGCKHTSPEYVCECKPNIPTPSCVCEKTPTSEDFECTGLAIAFVPEQEFSDLNEPENALCHGTLFQKLDMPFYGKKGRGCK